MQVLFLWDSNGEQDADLARRMMDEESDDPTVGASALEMANGAWEQRAAIDLRVERVAPQWPPRRQPGVDRNLIRLAVWELGNGQAPPKVILDEAIELAKKFSTEQSPAFINGVLDAVLREHLALTNSELEKQPGNDEIQMTNDESITE